MKPEKTLTFEQLLPQQRAVVESVRAGFNVLVTGPAGTGKSAVLRFLRDAFTDLPVAASTGVSALNVSGCTLHSWAGLGMGKESAVEIAKKLCDRRNSVWYGVKTTTRLAIDEISMIDAELFGKLDEVMRIVRKSERPFGGCQLVLFGDFCLKRGTQIIMSDGSLRKVEDVQIGECVMGPDSKPRKVLRRFSGVAPLFEVKQTNGSTYTVTGNHQLALRRRGSCRNLQSRSRRDPDAKSVPEWKRFPDVPNDTTILAKDMASKSGKFRESFGGYKAGLIALPERKLKIDPYFMGMWLGDGEKDSTRITSNDPEILEYCQQFAARWGLQCKTRLERSDTTCLRITITSGIRCNLKLNPVKELLREYGVFNNKHIPCDYLLNSEENRLKLLAGLLDTDGCWSGNRFIYCSKIERLAFEAKQLADHLGFRTSVYREKHGAWNIQIGGDTWRIPTKIKRKQSAVRPLGRMRTNSTLKVSAAGIGEFAGFETDGDHLFCLADGTVTHNCQLPPVGEDGKATRFAFDCLAWERADIRVFVLSEVVRQQDKAFAEILNRVRVGDTSEEVRRILRPRIGAVDPNPAIPAVELTTHNAIADKINAEHLAALPGKEYQWLASDYADSPALQQQLDRNCIAPKELILRPGAAVMLLRNLDLDAGLANGSLGVVQSIADDSKFGRRQPIVKFENGVTQELERAEWQMMRGKDVIASRRQFPLRLAWAMSVHKSQGMTLSKVRLHLKNCFADGQAYVALSRCKTLDGMFIADISGRSIRANPVALEFYRQAAEPMEAVA